MFGRPSFGVSQPSTFGFGSTSNAPFGQNQVFGNTSTGTFGGSTTSSGFGSNTQPMFGAPQQSGAPLFGTTSTPNFGQANQSGFGSSLFGSTAQQPSGSGLFGSSGNTAFGQQTKPSSFGFSAPSSGGLFGQNVQQPQQNSSLFQQSSGGLFGNASTFGTSTAPTGTAIKFTLVTGSDSMQKAGVAHTISTKHHCITCMKEYENKSLEELRWEDYQCNRKGPQQQTGFGNPPVFGQSVSTAPSLFGQAENKPIFGQSSTGFGQTPGFGLTSQSSAQNIFGKPAASFGTTTTAASSFGFGTNTSTTGGLFGTNSAAKPFGSTGNQSLFGTAQTPQNTGFGTSNIFGQTNAQNTGGLFGKPTQPTGFSTGQNSFTFGNPQPQNQTNLFQNTKPNTGFSIFGQGNTGTTGFGQQQSNFGGFNTFGKQVQNTFGQSNQPSFGLGMQSGGSIFGIAAVKPSSNLFGTSGTSNLFGNNNFQSNTGFTIPVQQQQQQQQQQNLVLSTEAQNQDFRNIVQLSGPYGYSPHLEGLSPLKPTEASYVTNPKELEKLLDTPQTINATLLTKRMKVLPATSRKTNVFDDAVDKYTSDINFTLKTSSKRLVLKKQKPPAHSTVLEADNDLSVTASSQSVNDTAGSNQIKGKGPKFTVPNLNLTSMETNDTYNLSPSKRAPSKSDAFNVTESGRNPEVSFTTEEIVSPSMKQSENSSNKSGETKTIDTCGVILTRPEYYTIPSLDKLIEHKNADGSCLIKGFTIGRVGYGSVSFPDTMDVANLNLDELVHFRYRELTIYPDDSNKPPLGQGLNRRAQVTLDRVYPKAKGDRSLVTNVETLIAINFSDTLRDICEKHGTKFLDYRPDTGSWVFTVEHFSKYGFQDSDDDDEPNEKLSKLKQTETKQPSEKMSFTPSTMNGLQSTNYSGKEVIVLNERKLDDNLHSKDEYMEECIGLGGLSDICDSIEDIDSDFPNNMLPKQFSQAENGRSFYKVHGNLAFLMKASLFDESFPTDSYTDVGILENRELYNGTVYSPILQKQDKVRVIKPDIFSVLNTSYNVAVDQSLFNCRNYVDTAIFKNRSYKIGWGKGLTFVANVIPFVNSKHWEKIFSSTVFVVDVSVIRDDEDFVDSVSEHFRIVLETSDVNITDGVPLFTVKVGKSALLRHQFLASEMAQQSVCNGSLEYYREIWDLCLAFWGPITKPDTRKNMFSKWLEIVTQQVESGNTKHVAAYGNEPSLFMKLYNYLTGHKILEAAELAMASQLPNLSMLLSQLNLNHKSKSAMQLQMKQWTTSLALDHIDTVTQKVYMIISGTPISNVIPNSKCAPVNICEGLDWRRALALHLWYVVENAHPLNEAVNMFKEAFSTYGYTARPTSQHVINDGNIFDLQYHLMLLYCNNKESLEVMLNPNTYSGHLFDYRLSWLLMQTFSSLQLGVISESAQNYIATSCSVHLENLGFYKWAIFVLLYIKDFNIKKTLVMGILYRNILDNMGDAEIEDEIIRDLYIPVAWIHEVKAYKKILLSRHLEAYKHLSFTENWYECHLVGITNVLPNLIINENYDVLKTLLTSLEAEHEVVINWKRHGGLLLNFLDLIESFNNKNDITRDDALTLHSQLFALSTSLTSFPTHSANQVACIAELSNRCAVIMASLLTYINPTYRRTCATFSAQVDQFNMPADYRMEAFYIKGIQDAGRRERRKVVSKFTAY